MENGSLEDWLHPSVGMNKPDTMRNLNFFQRINVAIDVAHALEYLHHRCETPIIHCDLKPSNVLLDGEMVGHIKMLTGKRRTNERFTKGLSLHNFVKTALPDQVVEIIDPILLQESVRGGIVAEITLNENNLGNDIHLQCLNSIFEIGLTCSIESPSERMDMSNVITKLCSIREKFLRTTRLRRGV
ncbi:hypothetical protein ES332_A10G263400v1 [Gossypium tomentosum]|uniref:Protein kinase domain-containing protein n=1 Tax=Gossypium tomentosum TaxID=34277 RepID=A0A5D2NWZ5_GOSTO|nr:hypothetical protein ES332_A10G263400v1 [Gossypium tomentosum]